jgi:hypothetical protein
MKSNIADYEVGVGVDGDSVRLLVPSGRAANYEGGEDDEYNYDENVEKKVVANADDDKRRSGGIYPCFWRLQQFCYTCSDVTVADERAEVNNKLSWTAAEALLANIVYYGFQYVIHNPTCNFLFKCGCTWTWAGGWKHCNIWNTNGGPKCPWCMSRAYISWTTDYLVFALMIVTYIYCLYRRKQIKRYFRLSAPIFMYFLSSIIVGLAFKVATGYPYFIF